MADKDDEATPFDDDRWIDRDDGTPDAVVDSDGPARRSASTAAVGQDREAEDSDALVDRDEDDAEPAPWLDPEPSEAAPSGGRAFERPPEEGPREQSTGWQSVEAWHEPAWNNSGEDWGQDSWDDPDTDADATPANPPPTTGGGVESNWEEDAEDAWDPSPGDDADAFNRAVERELSEHPYLGDSDDDEWDVSSAQDEPASMDSGREDEPGPAPAGLTTPAMPADPAEKADAARRRWPIASLAIGLLALALLAMGGVGILHERSALQAQVRDLQAQLARRPSAREVQEDRTLARDLEARVQVLTADLASLRSDYALLEGELAATREQLEEREAALETARAEAAAAKAAAKTAGERAGAAARPSDGGWFVNFGTYVSRSDAAARAGRLTVDKGQVVIQDAQSDGRTLYRVRVVGLANRAAAESVARDLEARFGLSKLWIGKTDG